MVHYSCRESQRLAHKEQSEKVPGLIKADRNGERGNYRSGG